MKRIFIGMGMLVLAALACGPGTAPPVPTQVGIGFALTAVIDTMTAQALVGQPTATFLLPVTDTPALPSNPVLVPTTEQPAPPPTLTLIPSPAIPLVSVSVATNCRTGPGEVYERISVADVGAKYQVVGKNSSNNYWIILLPDGRQCWLWGQYAVLEGNINLPEFVPPVPPVPTEVPLPVVGSIVVTVQAPLLNGRNDAAISDAKVSIDGVGAFPKYLGGGQYQFSDIPFGQYKVRVKASTNYDTWSSDFITVADFSVPSNVLARLEWTLRSRRGCSELSTIQARLKCYNEIMNVQTLVPPQLP